MLHGIHGDAEDPRLWLRHPLCAWHVPPGNSARAGRWNCPRTGWRTAIPGNSSAAKAPIEVGFGGHVEPITDPDGNVRHEWRPADHVLAVAFDTPIVGWRAARVNTLRLWSAQPIDPILLDRFNSGDHIGALEESARAEALTQVLYPADATEAGQELRLQAGVLLLLGLAAGHHSAAFAAIWRSGLPAGQGGDPAQRHASGDLGRRDDADSDRQSRARLGRGLEADGGDLRLYQPHASARGAGDLAGGAAGAAAAAAHADHLRDQCRHPEDRARTTRRSTTGRSPISP